MANLQVKDATATTVYKKTTGAGSDGDPLVEHINVDSVPGVYIASGTVTAIGGLPDVNAYVPSGTVGLYGVSKNSGTTDATTIRVVTASDGPLNTNMAKVAGIVTGAFGQVISPFLTDTTISIAGIVTGIAASSYVQGPNVAGAAGFYVRGHPDNTKAIYVGSTGAYARYPIGASEQVILMVPNLNLLWLSVDVAGEKVCWIKA